MMEMVGTKKKKEKLGRFTMQMRRNWGNGGELNEKNRGKTVRAWVELLNGTAR